jgi:hypothetical protein
VVDPCGHLLEVVVTNYREWSLDNASAVEWTNAKVPEAVVAPAVGEFVERDRAGMLTE